jgi:hypothetical protein
MTASSAAPLFGEESPPLVVPPAAAELEVPRRVSFTPEAEALNKRAGCDVPWLDVRLQSVETKLTKRVVEHQA